MAQMNRIQKDEEHLSYLRTYNTRKVTAEPFKRFLFNLKIE